MADELAKNQGKIPEGIDEKTKKEMMEVMKVAADLEKADEEAQMKAAMEESEKTLKRQKTQQDIEEDEFAKVLEMSRLEEEARIKKLADENEQIEKEKNSIK